MHLGCFERAWEESDRIAASGAPDPHHFWKGESWHGKRVMLRCLHGLGDTIQFIRFVSLLKTTCKSVTVQAHPEIVSLLAGVPGVDHVMTWGLGETEPEWDMQLEVNELARAFRITIDSLPAVVPYIRVPQERVDWAAERFPERRRARCGSRNDEYGPDYHGRHHGRSFGWSVGRPGLDKAPRHTVVSNSAFVPPELARRLEYRDR
jgi:hypothetical protein